MKVLSIGNLYPPAATGGYERIWVGAMRALTAAGHDVRVLTSDAPAAGPAPEGSPPVHRELRWYWRDHEFADPGPLASLRLERANAATLRRRLEDFAPDVVSYWGLGGMSLSLVEQVRRAGVPAVGLVADGWMVYGPEHDAWTRAWRRRPRLAAAAERLAGVPAGLDLGAGARWLFISEASRARSQAEGHCLERTALVHPGVDPSAFEASAPQPWGWRLAYVGRVEAAKGIGSAIAALAELGDARLTIDGPAEPAHVAELTELAERHGVGDRVRFQHSEPEAIAGVYAAADAVVFPVTWPEAWGLVPLEAMSVGRPVVATGTGGSGEYLADGENCLLFEPGDAAALAAAVRRLAADEALRRRLCEGGRATAARFTQAAFEAAVVEALEAEAARMLPRDAPG